MVYFSKAEASSLKMAQVYDFFLQNCFDINGNHCTLLTRRRLTGRYHYENPSLIRNRFRNAATGGLKRGGGGGNATEKPPFLAGRRCMLISNSGRENVCAAAGQTERLIPGPIAFEIIAIDRV